MAINLWRQSFNEVATSEGTALHTDICFWRKVVDRFIPKLKSHPNFRVTRTDATYEQRCAGYLAILEGILEEQILGMISPTFSSSQLERIGEFIAFAVTRGVEEAIVADPERASLIYDFLPRAWVDGAGLPPDKFADLYFKTTGSHRMPRFI
ncbi:MAG: hypothetical protein HY300_04305 [Verrucomicrobia bacterium]|nr:hypothetical protein [Verrucomicrobiota bacterium]